MMKKLTNVLLAIKNMPENPKQEALRPQTLPLMIKGSLVLNVGNHSRREHHSVRDVDTNKHKQVHLLKETSKNQPQPKDCHHVQNAKKW